MNDLRNARNALTRIVTGQNIGNVTEVPSANAFVVTDFAPNVCAIYRLLREMDVPSASSSTTSGEMGTVTLEHASAVELAHILMRHYGVQAAPAQARARGAAQVVQGPNSPRITADPRTNMLLLTGTADQLEAVKKAISLLDVPVLFPEQNAHLLRLKNIDAGDAARALTQLIMTAPGAWGSSTAHPVRPSVVAHDETNSLLISGSEGDYTKLRRLVEEMDVSKDKAEK